MNANEPYTLDAFTLSREGIDPERLLAYARDFEARIDRGTAAIMARTDEIRALLRYRVDVPEGESGNWAIERFRVSGRDSTLSIMRAALNEFGVRGFVPPGEYSRLIRRNVVGDPNEIPDFSVVVMSDTPDEVRDFVPFVERAFGSVFVAGLGLGVVVRALLERSEVGSVTVVERSADVIALAAPHYEARYGDRFAVVHGDAFAYLPPRRFDFVWFDVWDTIDEENLADFERVRERFVPAICDADRIGFWAMDECQKIEERGR